jgi:tetratricopeptide repeat protein 30
MQGVRKHPQLNIGAAAERSDVMSVGNSQVLHETALVEAFNLKAAVELQLQHMQAAREALADMPPRDLHELDAYTLHNRAIAQMDDDPNESFRTLAFLLSNPPFPSEAFANLLLSYIRPPNCMHHVAADMIAQYPDYSQAYLSPDLLAFFDAINLRQDAPDEAIAQLESIAKRHAEKLRLLTKLIQVHALLLGPSSCRLAAIQLVCRISPDNTLTTGACRMRGVRPTKLL